MINFLLEKNANPRLTNNSSETASDKLSKQPGFNSDTLSKLQRAESRSLQVVTRSSLKSENPSDVRLHLAPASPSSPVSPSKQI